MKFSFGTMRFSAHTVQCFESQLINISLKLIYLGYLNEIFRLY